MSNHDEIEVLIYDGPQDGVDEWRAAHGWRSDERKPYVWYAEVENSYTTGWLLTFPVFDDPSEEVDWCTSPLSKELEGASIHTYDEAVGVARESTCVSTRQAQSRSTRQTTSSPANSR